MKKNHQKILETVIVLVNKHLISKLQKNKHLNILKILNMENLILKIKNSIINQIML